MDVRYLSSLVDGAIMHVRAAEPLSRLVDIPCTTGHWDGMDSGTVCYARPASSIFKVHRAAWEVYPASSADTSVWPTCPLIATTFLPMVWEKVMSGVHHCPPQLM